MGAKKKAKEKAKKFRQIKALKEVKTSKNGTKRGAPVSPGGGIHADKPKSKEYKSKKNRWRSP